MFRAGILSDMRESKEGEMFLKDMDEKTLHSVINFVYTSELVMVPDQSLPRMIEAADKYDIPDLMKLLYAKIRREEYDGQVIADLLMFAHGHERKDLKEVIRSKIKANRQILKEEKFRNTMEEAHVSPTLLLDLISDLV